MFAVFVTFRIAEGSLESFMPLMKAQAENSLELEEACQVFEIWTKTDTPNCVQLYEVYDNASAFDDHLRSEHFKEFDAKVGPMIEDKTVLTFDRKL